MFKLKFDHGNLVIFPYQLHQRHQVSSSCCCKNYLHFSANLIYIIFLGENAENNTPENHREKTNRPAWSSSTPCHKCACFLPKIRIYSSKGLLKSWSILQNTGISQHAFRKNTSWVPLTEGMTHFEEALMHLPHSPPDGVEVEI